MGRNDWGLERYFICSVKACQKGDTESEFCEWEEEASVGKIQGEIHSGQRRYLHLFRKKLFIFILAAPGLGFATLRIFIEACRIF